MRRESRRLRQPKERSRCIEQAAETARIRFLSIRIQLCRQARRFCLRGKAASDFPVAADMVKNGRRQPPRFMRRFAGARQADGDKVCAPLEMRAVDPQ